MSIWVTTETVELRISCEDPRELQYIIAHLTGNVPVLELSHLREEEREFLNHEGRLSYG